MSKKLLLGMLVLNTVLPVPAAVYAVGNVNGSGPSLGLAIPDGNPSGLTSSLTVSGAGSALSEVAVTLNVSGGYNGDLYAYLVAPNGTLVTLLNRVGTGSGDPIQSAFGYATAGFNNVTLSDAGTGGNIHHAATPVSGTAYTPDGGSLGALNGSGPNGSWTLFFADESAGYTSTLNGWSLDITAVPEPVNVALAIFFGLGTLRWCLGKAAKASPCHCC